jgi:hypothetical protein
MNLLIHGNTIENHKSIERFSIEDIKTKQLELPTFETKL